MRAFVLDAGVIANLQSWPKPAMNAGKVHIMYRKQVGEEMEEDEEGDEEQDVDREEEDEEGPAKKQKVEGDGEQDVDREEDEEDREQGGEKEEEYFEEPHSSWNMLEFGEFVQAFWASSAPCILERKCYPSIWDGIRADFQKGKTRAIVIGHPGIGKSGFLLYVTWQLAQQSCRIVLQNKAGERTLLQTENKVYIQTRNSDDNFRGILSSDKNLYYLDGRLPQPPCFVGKLILACSTDYEEVMKDGKRTVFYMPVWNRYELAAADQEIFKLGIAFWSRRYKRWGGLVRYVLEQHDEVADKCLRDAIAIAGSGNMVFEAQMSGCSEKDEFSYKILHMMVSHDFRTFVYVFASKLVSDKVFRTLYTSQKAGLRSFLLFSGNAPLNSSFLELLAREILPRGGVFQTKRVYPAGQDGPLVSEHFDESRIVDSRRLGTSQLGSLFWPSTTTTEESCAFKVCKEGNCVYLDLYQVTFSVGKNKHGINAKEVLDLKVSVESVIDVEIPAENIIIYMVTLMDLAEVGGYQNWRGARNQVLKDKRLFKKLEPIVQKVMGIPM